MSKRKKYLASEDTEIPRRTKHRWNATTTLARHDKDDSDEVEDENEVLMHDEQGSGDDSDVHEQAGSASDSDDGDEDPAEGTEDSNDEVAESDTNSDDNEGNGDMAQEEDEVAESDTNSDDNEGNGNMAQEDVGHETIYPEAAVSKGQSLLLLLQYVDKHRVTGVQLEDLCKLFNIHLPNVLPRSKFLFRKQIPLCLPYDIYIYCENCESLLGKNDNEGRCSLCDTPFIRKRSISMDHFFIVFPLKEQLQDVLQNHNVAHRLLLKSAVCSQGDYVDILSGNVIRHLFERGIVQDSDFTVLWNMDGAQAFNSSNCAYWPLFITINELSPADRNSNMLMCGLWFGSAKPVMQTFMQPILDEVDNLSTTGFRWLNPVGQVNTHSKVFFVAATCDAVAHPMIRNSVQFNGQYGCWKCYHSGKRTAKGNGFVNCYPFKVPEPLIRTHESHMRDCTLAHEQGFAQRGVKGPSPIMLLQNFDVVNGFAVDYMHSVLLGVTRQFVNMWLDSSYHNNPWYIGTHLGQIDEILLKFKPPSELTRTPRSLKTRRYWKASEWRSFLLYYSLFVLKGILPDCYMKHWVLLSWAMYQLLQERISPQCINNAQLCLEKFVIHASYLYAGDEHITYNVHQLVHLADTVRNLGPLWCNSSFPFEGMNHTILQMKHGTQHTALQIADSYVTKRCIPSIERTSMRNASPEVAELNRRLSHRGGYLRKSSHIIGAVKLYGKPRMHPLILSDRLAIQRSFDVQLDVGTLVDHYDRFSTNSLMFSSQEYRHGKLKKRSDYVVQDSCGDILLVKKLVAMKLPCQCDIDTCSCQVRCIVLFWKCVSANQPYFRDEQVGIVSDYIKDFQATNETVAAMPERIAKKCILLSVWDKEYATPLPNSFETD